MGLVDNDLRGSRDGGLLMSKEVQRDLQLDTQVGKSIPPENLVNIRAANATEHLFLAYLRSIAPTPGQISAALPLSLSQLLSQTAYPPKPVRATPIAPGATSILRVTLSVRNVSPTPFAL